MPPSPPPSDTCLAFLIRHGATENNVANPPLLQGSATDPGLSLEGHRQAERAADRLADEPLAAVYSSPLRRALETAETLARPHGLPVQQVPDLKEVDVGRWESRSWKEISQHEPDDYARFMADAATHGYPEGENMIQLLHRIQPTLETLLAANLGNRIVIVGHNVVCRVFIAHLLAIPLAEARRVSHHNCGISIVKYRNGQIKLRTLNTAFHLDEY
jgi:broad specificity phosphatase PhoE